MKEFNMKNAATVNSKSQTENKKDGKRKTSVRQTAALIGVVLLALLYVVTLIAAVTDSSASGTWFRASLGATMALPLLIWIYTWLYGKLTGKRTVGDPSSSVTEDATDLSASSEAKDIEG